ncbi:MAG: tyrosine-type recombinase/integrase [Leptospiraceae bacterium]|jgi:integrase|nr:tyrosine-type recombinase/integrase [Leptospiraceae bacterium]
MNSTAISNLQQNGTYFLKPVGNITMDAHIGQFNLWAKEHNVDNFGNPLIVSTSTIKDFFDHLLTDKNKYGRKNRASTLHGYKSAIKKSVSKTFKMSMEEKVAFELFFRKIKLPKAVRSIKAMTIDELQALIDESDIRTSLMIRFLVISGLRISEMINIRLSDVLPSDDKTDFNIYVIGKGNKEGIVSGIPKILISEIQTVFQGKEYLFERNTKPKRANENKEEVMKYTRRQMYVLIEKAGLSILGKRINPHMTRHTCGRILMDRLKDVNKVQDRLRHSSVRTTIENYLTTKITNKDVKEAFDGIL